MIASAREGILLSVKPAATNVVPGALARSIAASGVQPEDVEMDRQEVRCSDNDRAGHGYMGTDRDTNTD